MQHNKAENKLAPTVCFVISEGDSIGMKRCKSFYFIWKDFS